MQHGMSLRTVTSSCFSNGTMPHSFCWAQTQFCEETFHTLASLLARHQQQQDPNSISEGQDTAFDNDSYSDDEDVDTANPRSPAEITRNRSLTKKFLDRLAEAMSAEKGGRHVCATVAVIEKDQLVIYVAKNEGLTMRDRNMLAYIQIWLRALATTGLPRDTQDINDVMKDRLWQELVAFGAVKGKANVLRVLQEDVNHPLHFHAEVQLLMHLSADRVGEPEQKQDITYIGCSKKPCFLCSYLLNDLYETKLSHGNVYPHWTIPPSNRLGAFVSLKLHARVSAIGKIMIERLRNGLKNVCLPTVESTAAITEVSPTTRWETPQKKTGATGIESTNDTSRSPQKAMRSPLRKTHSEIWAVRVPVLGEELTLVKIEIKDVSSDYEASEQMDSRVADFGEYWPGATNFDRDCWTWALKGQTPSSLNGNYQVHFNINHDLGPNEYLRQRVVKGPIPFAREFWYGDVFILKFGSRLAQKINTDLENSSFGALLPKSQWVDFDEKGFMIYQDVCMNA